MGHALPAGTCPRRLEDRGGWLARATVNAFSRYAEEVVKRLGDRVKNWFTVNEIPCFIGNGYGNGYFAPGKRVGARRPESERTTTLCSRSSVGSKPCGHMAGPGPA